MSATNQNLIRQYAGNLRQVQTLYETCPIYARPKAAIREIEEIVVTTDIFNRENAEVVLKACERYWHFSYLQRHQANDFLIKETPGNFIVRRSSKTNSFALSIRLPPTCSEPVTHYLILKDATGYMVQGSKLPFPTLYSLLAHFCFKQSGGMPCLLRPPRVPVPKSSLQPTAVTQSEEPSESTRSQRLEPPPGRPSNSRSHQIGVTPPPLPPPRRSQDNSTTSVPEGLSIVPVDGSSSHKRGSSGDTVDPQYTLMFDRIAKKVSHLMNRDDAEDFELEVSDSDDSGDDDQEPNREPKGNQLKHTSSAPSTSSSGDLPTRPHSMQGHPDSLHKEESVPPVPPRQCITLRRPRESSPSPPPLPPRHSRERLSQNRISESHLQNTTNPINLTKDLPPSPIPTRPPKPSAEQTSDRDPVVGNGQEFTGSITDTTVEQWRSRSNDMSDVSTSPIAPSPPLSSGGGVVVDNSKPKAITSHPASRVSHPAVSQATTSEVEHAKVSSPVPPPESVGGEDNITRGSKSRSSGKTKKKKKKFLLQFMSVKPPNVRIAQYIKEYATTEEGPFSDELNSFCTRVTKKISNYQELLQETRKCMDQLRKILLKDYSSELEKRGKKRCKAFDEVVERSLQDVVINPLYLHILSVMDSHFEKTHDLQIVKTNIDKGRCMKQSDVGIRDNIVPPNGQAMAAIAETLEAMQKTTSAMRKMELLLEAVKLTYDNIKDAKDQNKSMRGLGADDFLPIFVWVLIQCQCYRAEVEAEYMWGLVHPSLLNGEGGYYLTTLTSAVHVIKQLKFDNTPDGTANETLSSMSDCMAFLEVYIEDPVSGRLMEPTLIPVHPTLDTSNTCQLILTKCQEYRLDPSRYGLFIVDNQERKRLPEDACPQAIKSRWSNNDTSHRYFAYLKVPP